MITDILELRLVFEMTAPRNERVKKIPRSPEGLPLLDRPFPSRGRTEVGTAHDGDGPPTRKKKAGLSERDELFVFLTTGNVSEGLIPRMIENCDHHWGMEMGVRMRNDFVIPTTTRKPVLTYFFFIFAIMLYDQWLFSISL
ncbi:MAG: hypothetical protein QW379_07910 [Thermoplasmata archaeon]